MKIELNDRDKSILQAIINDYILTAEPVGSRTVSKKYDFDLSSATIRNIMADLEESGFLRQPHTSAGRVPTDKGYRFYVDLLLELRGFSKRKSDSIEKKYKLKEFEISDLLRETSKTLSTISHYIGIVLSPRFVNTVFKHIEFIRMGKEKILVIFVAESGLIQNKIIETGKPISQEKLDKITRLLNDEFKGLTLRKIRDTILGKMAEDKVLYDKLLQQALELSEKAFKIEKKEDIYVEGRLNIINQPEFADIEKMKNLFKTFEEKGILIKLLDECLDAEGIQIFIGSENPIHEMQGCSLITSTYKKGDHILGSLGVVGPTRMEYARVIPIVDYTARLVSKFLTKIE